MCLGRAFHAHQNPGQCSPKVSSIHERHDVARFLDCQIRVRLLEGVVEDRALEIVAYGGCSARSGHIHQYAEKVNSKFLLKLYTIVDGKAGDADGDTFSYLKRFALLLCLLDQLP